MSKPLNKLAQQRAQRAGLELDELRNNDPQTYKMLHAERLLETESACLADVSAVALSIFREHDLFELVEKELRSLLIYPQPQTQDLHRLDDALGRLAQQEKYATQAAYYRIVSDESGEHRQFRLPLTVTAWQGEVNLLVGPFANQQLAEDWTNQVVKTRQLLADAIPHAGQWYCDVFKGL